MSDFGFELPDEPEEEVPDWLHGLGDEDQPPPRSTADPEDEDQAEPPFHVADDSAPDETPDWLADIRAAESQRRESSQPQPAGEQDSSWLDDIRHSEQSRQLEHDQPSDGFAPDDALEWDPASASEIPSAGTPSGPDEDVEQDGGLDWLSGLGAQAGEVEGAGEFSTVPPQDQPGDSPIVHPAVANLEGEQPSEFVDTGSLPSWLVEIKRGGSQTSSLEEPGGMDAPGGQDDRSADFPQMDFTPQDLPDWLDEPPPPDPEPVSEEPSPSAEPAPDLARASLPNWLSAMRPSESPVGLNELSAGLQETIGPLSGLQNLIPAEPDIVQFGRSPSFYLDLDVTESQERSTAIFEQLLEDQGPQKRSRIPVEAITQGAVRWVVNAILLLSVAVAVILGSDSFDLPSPASPHDGALAVQVAVDAVPPQAPVLVAFDYQPAFTAELYAASTAVFDHLLLKGAQLVLLSTHPTGTIQADNFLQATLAPKHTYIADRGYTDLGYLSGGPAGLRAFAASPARTLPVFDQLEGAPRSAWETAPLAGIGTIADFAMVVVITDSPEVARSWIEQVGPLLDSAPLVMIVSEQAEPFLLPYLRSPAGQLDALMAGIQDGAFYESALGLEHASRLYWNSYSVALGVALAVISLGTLAGAASMLVARFRRPAKEAAP